MSLLINTCWIITDPKLFNCSVCLFIYLFSGFCWLLELQMQSDIYSMYFKNLCPLVITGSSKLQRKKKGLHFKIAIFFVDNSIIILYKYNSNCNSKLFFASSGPDLDGVSLYTNAVLLLPSQTINKGAPSKRPLFHPRCAQAHWRLCFPHIWTLGQERGATESSCSVPEHC